MSGHGYLRDPGRYGYQPESRYPAKNGQGALRYHSLGCRVDGGPGVPYCAKCATDSPEDRFIDVLVRSDRKGAA